MKKTRKNIPPAEASGLPDGKGIPECSAWLLPAGFIALLTIAVYVKALGNDFLEWDDPAYVFDNFHIRSLDLRFLKWAFLNFHSANWHPVTWISHALDYAVWGLNPLGHHMTSIVIHAVNSSLAAVLCMKLLEARRDRPGGGSVPLSEDRQILIAAVGTGVLFGIHPIHVESVAWVAERKDLLCAMFFLFSVLAYTAHVRSSVHKSLKKPYLYYSLLFFALALMSKPMAVSLPLVLLILDWHPFRRIDAMKTFTPAIIEKLPFMALSLLSALITIMAQRSGGTMALMEEVPFLSRLLVAAKAIILYLVKLAVPVGLSPYYPYPPPNAIAILYPGYFVPVTVLAGAVALLVLFRRKVGRLLPAAGGYYLVTLLPVIGIIQVGGQFMADRYSYLPSIGPFFLVGVIGALAWEKTAANAGARYLSAAAAIAFIAVLSSLTLKQISIWNNSIDFWSHVIRTSPRPLPIAYNNRGIAYESKGEVDKALADFNTAIKVKPDHADAYVSRGATRFRRGDLDGALEDFNSAINLFSSPETLYNLYSNRGAVYRLKKEYDRALKDYNAAIAVNPDSLEAYNNRGILYEHMGQPERALENYSRMLVLNPGFVPGYLNRGNVYLKMGNRDLAMNDFRTACTMGSNKGCEKAALYGNGRQ